MKFANELVILVALVTSIAFAQDASKPTSPPQPKSVTVPITLDHNRVLIDVDLPLPDGSKQRIRAWVDNGNPDFYMSQRVATLLGLNITCKNNNNEGEKNCSVPSPLEIAIGEMKISLAGIKPANIPLKPPAAASVMAPGMNAEINIPSTVLRNYDVLLNFPDHQLTIGLPGSLKFKGIGAKVMVNSDSGVIQVPSKIENKKYNLALDLGSSISFLPGGLFNKLAAAHPDWPHMTGAIGPANQWGLADELKWKLMRVDRLQFGPLYLTNVPVVDFEFSQEKEETPAFEKRAGIAAAGSLGSEALSNYRIGIDYAHSMVYFDIGRTFNFPDFDVVGLILRPQDDGRFTIIDIADLDGKPGVPELQPGDYLVAVDGVPVLGSTMGQVWAMLGGVPGKERSLTIEHGGKQTTIPAKIQHFMGEALDMKKN